MYLESVKEELPSKIISLTSCNIQAMFLSAIQLLEYPILPSQKICHKNFVRHKKAGFPRTVVPRVPFPAGAAKF